MRKTADRAFFDEIDAQPLDILGAFPSPRNPGSPGLRIIVRKSGRPDLRWGGVRGGGGLLMHASRATTTTPLPNPPPQGGREQTECAAPVPSTRTENALNIQIGRMRA